MVACIEYIVLNEMHKRKTIMLLLLLQECACIARNYCWVISENDIDPKKPIKLIYFKIKGNWLRW